jgi:Xaa-Pro aminopeptidase
VSIETLVSPFSEGSEFNLEARSDRRADIEAKQTQIAALLRQVGRDGLLLTLPENFTWLTSGGTPRGVLDPATGPAIYCTHDARWVICCNTDSLRLFDEEIEALGFQLKEWPWHWGREQFLNDLCANRRVACDVDMQVAGDFVNVAPLLAALRRVLTAYEQAALMAVGAVVVHAVEAACRTAERDETEREIAGQVAHRLVHRGVFPTDVGVAVDGRSRHYRRHGFTAAPLSRHAVITATGRKYGLHATAARMVCFGDPPDDLRGEVNAVCKVSAGYVAATWPDALPREILLAGRRIYLLSGYEHEWLQAPQGHVTGRLPVEVPFLPRSEELLHAGWPVVWQVTAGAAVSADTFLVHEEGAVPVTPTENWPQKRIRIQGAEVVRPDVLVR